MDRRRFLALAALSVPLPGCAATQPDTPTDSDPATSTDAPTETPTPTSVTSTDTPTETPTPTSASSPTPTDDCEWPDMCEGSQIVEATVNRQFSGEVVLEAGCRGETFTVDAGESVVIERETDAEQCLVTLTVDGEEAYSEDIPGYKRVTVTVKSDGEVDVEAIVY